MNKIRFIGLCFAALAALAACTPLAKVHEMKPRLAGPPGAAVELRKAEQLINEGNRVESRDPHTAMGDYLAAADSALARLQKSPGDHAALRDYDFALSRMFGVIGMRNVDAWSKPVQCGGYTLTYRKDARSLWNPVDFDFIPVDQLIVGGEAFRQTAASKGLGAPVVAVNRNGVADYRKRFLGSKHVYYCVTAVARFEGKRCVVSFEDPLAIDTVAVNGRTYPLAADYSAGPAMMLAKERPDKLGFVRLVLPGKYENTAHITRLQPFDPDKIPVLFVHGLQDTPATWAKMINTLESDPVLRKHYQYWLFSYPSGFAYPYSAMVLRRQLDAVHKAYPTAKRMVLVGHSMGGMISRLMITDSGNKIWEMYFKRTPEETHLPRADKQLLAGMLVFKARSEVSRVIFMSTPHRGSDLASNWIGRIASSIVRLPSDMLATGRDTLNMVVQDDPSAMKMRRMPNSIDTLSPNNRFVKFINTLPMANVPYHSIIGDRGRGDTPNSSDGVVAYWSSHLDGAQSECIVPSNHMSIRSPEGIAEVSRILKLNLKQ